MKAFEKLLVPVDFSLHAEEAMRTAADLSSRYGASITLAYVYEPMQYVLPEGFLVYTPDQVNMLTAGFRERLARSEQHLVELGAASVQTELLQGPVAREIVDYATSGGFDLIVMGTHGRTGLKHMMMGSVAEKVLRLAPCPVLVVKLPPGAAGESAAAQ
jgi:universal stress protein A